MNHLLLSGDWKDCWDLLQALTEWGCMVSVLPEGERAAHLGDLVLARVTSAEQLPQPGALGSPWLAWCAAEDPNLIAQSYRSGALAVFPRGTPPAVILQVVRRTLASLAPAPEHPSETIAQRRYQRGDVILLEPDTVLEIRQGIIAQTMVHQDGSQVLLGLCGPEQLVVPHPADTCYIQLVAHTNAAVTIKSWQQASRDAEFPEKLRSRLQQMEAWAAMQARPHLDQRVFGILSLLAEQFGVASPQGEMVDIRITHTQLATAVGATRTTITRTLGDLRRQGILSLVQTADGERFCLLQWEHGHHGLP